MIRQVCSWCGVLVRCLNPEVPGIETSHGACRACLQIELAKLIQIERDPETNFARPVAGVSLTPRNEPAPACAVRSRDSAGVDATNSAPASSFSADASKSGRFGNRVAQAPAAGQWGNRPSPSDAVCLRVSNGRAAA